VSGCNASGIAARICYDLELNGYTDWYLPSLDELNKLYQNKGGVGGFASGAYWSSSVNDANNAWHRYFDKDLQNYDYKHFTFHVRAVRVF
jgi:hypothetical protein